MILKVCGITRESDALHAVEHGATALGFIFWPRSPRYVEPSRAAAIIATLPAAVTTVGVFVDDSVDRVRTAATTAGVTVVQLHGDEPPGYDEALAFPIFRSATLDDATAIVRAWPEAMVLLDAADRQRRGGTGQAVDWVRAAEIARHAPLILAGGLTPENVAEAIDLVQPDGVDVSSGVEAAPGIKDPDKVMRFLSNARGAFERRSAWHPVDRASKQGPVDRAGKR